MTLPSRLPFFFRKCQRTPPWYAGTYRVQFRVSQQACWCRKWQFGFVWIVVYIVLIYDTLNYSLCAYESTIKSYYWLWYYWHYPWCSASSQRAVRRFSGWDLASGTHHGDHAASYVPVFVIRLSSLPYAVPTLGVRYGLLLA